MPACATTIGAVPTTIICYARTARLLVRTPRALRAHITKRFRGEGSASAIWQKEESKERRAAGPGNWCAHRSATARGRTEADAEGEQDASGGGSDGAVGMSHRGGRPLPQYAHRLGARPAWPRSLARTARRRGDHPAAR